MRRRSFLSRNAAILSGLAIPAKGWAQSQDWPTRPVRIVAPSAPGGSLDILSRMFGKGLSERLGQPFPVENRSGSGGNIGFDAVAKSRPDGYTIMIASDPLAVNPSMFGKLPFDPLHDFAPIIMIATLSQVLAVNPKVPATTFAEFVDQARTRAFAVLDAVRTILLCTNLGDVKTLVSHPASTSHGRLTEAQRQAAGIGQGLIRVSVGLEHVNDLKADLARALDAIAGGVA